MASAETTAMLSEIRSIVQGAYGEHGSTDHVSLGDAQKLVRLVADLDQRLSAGHALPLAWEAQR